MRKKLFKRLTSVVIAAAMTLSSSLSEIFLIFNDLKASAETLGKVGVFSRVLTSEETADVTYYVHFYKNELNPDHDEVTNPDVPQYIETEVLVPAEIDLGDNIFLEKGKENEGSKLVLPDNNGDKPVYIDDKTFMNENGTSKADEYCIYSESSHTL